MNFREKLHSGVVYLDGATGTNLQACGMPTGVCPESWVLENEDIFVGLQKKYIAAGSDALYSMTFSCNRVKLAEYGLEDSQEQMIRDLVSLSRKAIEESGTTREIAVLGDISMTGKQLAPVGEMTFDELFDIYKETAQCMVKAGVDGFAIETMMSLSEARAALLAVKEVSDLPAMVTLTYESDGRTLFGTEPGTAVSVLQAMGADAVGLNCSTGPDEMLKLVERTLEFAKVPVIVKPNAGMPKLVEGRTTYDLGAEEFATQMKVLADAGATVLGGCCGTTDEHIDLLVKATKDSVITPSDIAKDKKVLTTERNLLEIDTSGVFSIVGERINPTGKKALQESLRAGDTEPVMDMAVAQVEAGAKVLDVNLGMNGIDEKEMMCRVVEELTLAVDVPLCIDSSDPEVIEAALRIYPGRALINSISLEPGKAEKLLPVAKKYGAMFILLPLTEEGLPKNMEEKHASIDKLMGEAAKYGLGKNDIIVDGLVATVGANKRAAIEVMETVRHCRDDLGCATICGLSNISFGLPERVFVNSAFLTMAIANGLTMAIANPSQTLLTNAAYAADLLLAKEGADEAYISGVKGIETFAPATADGKNDTHSKRSDNPIDGADGLSELATAVMKGKSEHVTELVDNLIKEGNKPGDIIDEHLIPAITKVGDLYEKKIYFLPQLISSAESMSKAVEYIEPMLAASGDRESLETVVVATVKGDVHDIGKNLVVLMLKNYGYDVIDLGKDVETELIIETAKEKNAAIIGLSALMTTTMTEMAEVVKARNEAGIKAKIIIGGACVTGDYAKEIGADGYSEDAQEAVKLVNKMLGH